MRVTVQNDPQQEIFTRVKLDLEALGHTVFDGAMPPDNTPYPFDYLGDVQQTDSANKSAVFGNVYQTIHVWHSSPKQRGTVSRMLLDIKTVCRKISHTDNFSWMVVNVSQRIITDNTTKSPLLHGVLEVEWKFS